MKIYRKLQNYNRIITEKEENTKEENQINIFFCSNGNTECFDEVKSFMMISQKQFKIIGEFNIDSIISEISYYLGIEDKNHEEIDEKEIKNIIIFNIPSNQIEKILQSFIEKFDGNIGNDDYPFFVFIKRKNSINDLEINNFLLNLNNNQKEITDSAKLDSRNIYFETEEKIINTIKKIYNYYNSDYTISLNDDDEKKEREKYNITKTINILVMGKRGSGKSTFINRVLGEKKAYAQVNAKTSKTREYFHKYYPIKFIDSAGFQVDGLERKDLNEIQDINKYLEEHNLTYNNIKKKVHFIFYVFRANDKFDDSVIQLLKKLLDFKIEIFFIITYSKQGEEKIYKNNFKTQIKKDKIFPKEKISDIINNTFCVDLFNIYYSKTISDIFLLINGKLKEYEEMNNTLIDLIGNNNLVKTKELGYIFNLDNEQTPLGNDGEESLKSSIENLSIIHESQRGKIFNHYINDTKEIIGFIKLNIKSNIFLTDFQIDRESKKELSKNIVKEYVWPGFWWSNIIFWGEELSKKSKMKMIEKISEIYEIPLPDNYIKDKKKDFLNSAKEEDSNITKFIYKIGTFIAGIWNKNNVIELGEKLIEEFDFEYAKKNIFDLYLDMAKKYNKSFKMINNFYKCFNNDYWYDIKLEK